MQPLSEARPYTGFTNHLNSLPFLAAFQQTSGLFPRIQRDIFLFRRAPRFRTRRFGTTLIRSKKIRRSESCCECRRKRGFMRKLALLLAALFFMANGCVISPRRTVGGSG